MSRVLANPEAVSAGSLSRFEVPECKCELDLIHFLPPDAEEWLITPTRVRDPEVPTYRLLALIFGTDACRHTLDKNHRLSLDKWAELERLLSPSEYDDPPPPTRPAMALTRAARVEVYRRRCRSKRSLYHEDDLWRKGCLAVGIQGKRARNGSLSDGAFQMRGSA